MFDLDLIPEATKRQTESPDPLPPNGVRIAEDCRAATSHLVGPWKRGAGSDYERDALAQSLALWCVEHPERLEDRPTWERRALLRDVARGILRDQSGDVADSLQERTTRDRRNVTLATDAATVIRSGETMADMQRRYRAAERLQRRPVLTSMEAVTRRHRDETGLIAWEEVAADVAAEEYANEPLPASELAADVAEVCERMAERVEEALAERNIGLANDGSESILIALQVAHGHRLTDIARERGFSHVTAKRRSAGGMKALQTLPALGIDLIGVRRSVIAAILAEEAELFPADVAPRNVAEVDRLNGWQIARSACDHAWHARLVGVPSTVADVQRGSAAEVLAHIARLEHAVAVMEADAFTVDTADARPAPSASWFAYRSRSNAPALPVWQDPTVSVLGTATGNHPASPLWPNDTIGGQPSYRWPHQGILRDVIGRKYGQHAYSTDAYAARDTDSDA